MWAGIRRPPPNIRTTVRTRPADMTTRELRQLLEHVEDTREIVLRGRGLSGSPSELDERHAVWGAARAEANLAYEAWRSAGGGEAYAVYRAAEDRADAAEDTLAIASTASE